MEAMDGPSPGSARRDWWDRCRRLPLNSNPRTRTPTTSPYYKGTAPENCRFKNYFQPAQLHLAGERFGGHKRFFARRAESGSLVTVPGYRQGFIENTR